MKLVLRTKIRQIHPFLIFLDIFPNPDEPEPNREFNSRQERQVRQEKIFKTLRALRLCEKFSCSLGKNFVV